jgi:hypothetical protein
VKGDKDSILQMQVPLMVIVGTGLQGESTSLSCSGEGRVAIAWLSNWMVMGWTLFVARGRLVGGFSN